MILFFILFFIPRPITTEHSEIFVVWNVGQGSTSTLITDKECVHIDMGGEEFPKALPTYCRGKKNFLFITHYDWDHINLLKKMLKSLPNLCLIKKPNNKLSRHKHQLLDPLLICKTSPIEIRQVDHSTFKFDNESNSYLVENKILITGDAPQKQEREIVKNLPRPGKIQILLLGHHGSRTSTGTFLLHKLGGLRLAIASARKKRYGHPHKEVMARLQTAAVPWLSTEGYGHIFIELHH